MTDFKSFDGFRAGVVPLSTEDAEQARQSFVTARLDPALEAKAADALALRSFSDGPAYTGYLWDYLAEKEIVTEPEIWRRLEKEPLILVMWDIHSTERVRVPNYFKFPKGTVLRSRPGVIQAGLKYLPKDLYLFDETFNWAGALTHEWVDGEHYCLWSGGKIASATKDVLDASA